MGPFSAILESSFSLSASFWQGFGVGFEVCTGFSVGFGIALVVGTAFVLSVELLDDLKDVVSVGLGVDSRIGVVSIVWFGF